MDGYNPPLPARYWHQEEVAASDLIAAAVGYPLVPCEFQFAIVDEQLDAARSALASIGYQEVSQTHRRCFAECATKETFSFQTTLDLFEKVMVPSVRKKVCYQRQQIRAGVVTPRAARALIPRFDLRLATCLLAAQDGFSNVGGELRFGDIGTLTVVILTTAVETVTLENLGNDLLWRRAESKLSRWYRSWRHTGPVVEYEVKPPPRSSLCFGMPSTAGLQHAPHMGSSHGIPRCFRHEDAKLCCMCEHNKSPEHLVFCCHSQIHFSHWLKRPAVRPCNRATAIAYLGSLILLDFMELLELTQFYTQFGT
ncbi:hypothetical protein I7I51_04078 [Histoplasma capsulatum]|uniref:Uncharacterized protein n=1 Tax=Ajellomyces capsulatus TaxID=5037 RepID=A0A8A1M7F6_AJECA|nr:hypothetical protein I7I51_04078 [Histoplasma capsulatum]